MPRKSEPDLSIAAIGPRRLEPPPELGTMEAEIFRQTVASVPPQHFAGDDLPILAEYCRTAAIARRAAEALAISPVAGDRVSPYLEVHKVTARTAMALSVRLRIGARSRSTNTRRGKATAAPSYYDLMGDVE
jgi:hypothetical protein